VERDLLRDLLAAGLSLDAIAERVDRSPSTVSYWLKKHGLRAVGAERYGPKPLLPEHDLAVLIAEGLSVVQIADRLNCAPSLVRRYLRRYGLISRQSRNRSDAREALGRGQRMTRLVCRRHGDTSHILEGRGAYRCMRCRAERVAEHRRRVKRLLIAEAGGRCALCGYARCEAALQFHHLDPTMKSFHLSVRGVTKSIAALREEAAKCVLLCATCHAEVEAGYTTLDLH
jgi:DNA-binding CsgD family transcriptional regulator/DNA-directed RNA polymerase subunit RPC12/RpoP